MLNSRVRILLAGVLLKIQHSGKPRAEGSSLIKDFDVSGATAAENVESFVWDGLALISRSTLNAERGTPNGVSYTIEPHVNGGSPMLVSHGDAENAKVIFNDILGSSLGIAKNGKFTGTNMTSFGEADPSVPESEAFFTGKPMLHGMGYAFLFRNYRADVGKWQTADPLGYPDGWNNLAYCGNNGTNALDPLGLAYDKNGLTDEEVLQLAGSLSALLTAANLGVFFIPGAGYWNNRPLTLSFLTRYMFGLGDQELDYSIIENEKQIESADQAAIAAAKSGASSYAYEITGWNNKDFFTSFGRVMVWYNITVVDNTYVITGTINDVYDFHSKLSVPVPGLNIIGRLYGWKGGNVVYDTWMRQLAEHYYAYIFSTKITWTIIIPE